MGVELIGPWWAWVIVGVLAAFMYIAWIANRCGD